MIKSVFQFNTMKKLCSKLVSYSITVDLEIVANMIFRGLLKIAEITLLNSADTCSLADSRKSANKASCVIAINSLILHIKSHFMKKEGGAHLVAGPLFIVEGQLDRSLTQICHLSYVV